MQAHLPPCACSATIAESEITARFRKELGLYFMPLISPPQ